MLHLANLTLRLYKDELGLASDNLSPVHFWMRILGTPSYDQMSIAASEGEPELLERKIRLRCRSGGSNAWIGSGSDGYAFPGHRKGRARVEKATVSRTLEVGRLVSRGSLCWFSAPCPGCLSPGRAWGLTGRGRHLLLPETDLLTPPPSPPSVVQLGVTGSPRWSGQLRCKCVLILSPPGRANRASSSGPVGTRLVSSGEAYVACGDAAST